MMISYVAKENVFAHEKAQNNNSEPGLLNRGIVTQESKVQDRVDPHHSPIDRKI